MSIGVTGDGLGRKPRDRASHRLRAAAIQRGSRRGQLERTAGAHALADEGLVELELRTVESWAQASPLGQFLAQDHRARARRAHAQSQKVGCQRRESVVLVRSHASFPRSKKWRSGQPRDPIERCQKLSARDVGTLIIWAIHPAPPLLDRLFHRKVGRRGI